MPNTPSLECEYQIGTGIHDITGSPRDLGMMGYAMPHQRTKGLHTRLWARAFAIVHPESGHRIMMVNTDLWSITKVVKEGVMDRLQKVYGDLYTEENVMLMATHTHSGPGGYSSYLLYNFTVFGFSKKNYDVIVNGITQSIIQAHENLDWGTIHLSQGELLGVSMNRSLESYRANTRWDQYPHDTNKEMTVLKFVKANGKEIGVFNWFAVHATSMGNQHHYISSDNKGYAEYLFEKEKQTDYQASETFVAAFANSEQGDVSPNLLGDEKGEGKDDFESTKISGKKQYLKAKTLYNKSTKAITGGLDFRYQWVRMPDYVVHREFTGNREQVLGYSAKGVSFAAGAKEDGPSHVPGMAEGLTQAKGWNFKDVIKKPGSLQDKALQLLALAISKVADDPRQFPKPVLIPAGKMPPSPWAPQILAFQLFRLGPLAIIAVPGEMTTMCARYLKAEVLKRLTPKGVTHAVIAGLANMYSGYITTTEEYQIQRYEGASTHFGPYTSSAYFQVYSALADAMVKGNSVPKGTVKKASKPIINLPDLTIGWTPLNGTPGTVLQQPKETYHAGETVKTIFRSTHPHNGYMTQSSFLKVEYKNGAGWKTIATDNDWETKATWTKNPSGLQLEIDWDIPEELPQGLYRIVHEATVKTLFNRNAYRGESKIFIIQSAQ